MNSEPRTWNPKPGRATLGWGLGLALGLAFHARADGSASGFEQANRLYEEGQFKAAAAAYEKLVYAGKVSVAIYYNLGNACFKAGQVGRAIAAYRAAETLRPRDPDVAANLKFARDSVSGPPAPVNRWIERLRKLTLDEWTVLTAGATWFWFALLIGGVWRPDLRRACSGYTATVGLVAAVLAACLVTTCYDRFAHTAAVVIARDAIVRYGPLAEAQSAFTLPDGAEVTVLDQNRDWLEVQAGTQRTGWVRRDQLAVLTPSGRIEAPTAAP